MLLSVVLHLHPRTFDGKKNITIVGVSFVEFEKLQQMILILPIVELGVAGNARVTIQEC